MKLKMPVVWLIGFLLLALMPGYKTYAAGTITYKYINGDTIAATDSTAATEFTNANAEITGAGYNVIAYIYDTCRLAEKPGDFTSNKELTAVTTKDVSEYGTIGDGIWFIYNKTLYVTGNDTISDTSSTYSNTSRKDSHTGDELDIFQPSVTYGDIEGSGYGVKLPYVGDEKDLEKTFYEYTPPAEEYLAKKLSDRNPTYIASGIIRFNKPPTGKCNPTAVGWYPYASGIETVYFSEDLSLVGNFAYMFNANSTYSIPGQVGSSAYTALKNVYLYSDLSGITSTAGMFARCPLLEHVYVKGNSVNLRNNTSTAFMFYGDENLVNGDGSLIDRMDMSTGSLMNTTYMFADCPGIVHPAVKDFNMSNVTITDGMFYGATKAGIISSKSSSASYNIYNWNLGNVVTANFMFSGLLPLKDTGEPDLDNPQKNVAPGLKTIDGSETITDAVDMSHWGIDKCITTYYMFAKASKITSVTMEDSYEALQDASGMFMRCDNLKVVDMSGCSLPALLYTTAMFRGTGMGNTGGKADLSGVTMPSLVNADLMFEASGFSTINLDGSSNLSTLKSAIAMFADNTHLSSLGNDAAQHLVLESLSRGDYMFSGDSSLSSLNTGGWKMSSAENLSHMFADCRSLGNFVTFDRWDFGNALTDMECFMNNTSIGAAVFINSDTSGVKNFFLAFANCPKLVKASFKEKANMDSAVTAAGMFFNDPLLAEVTPLTAAPELKDARGFFMNDEALLTVDVSTLIDTPESRYVSFFFKGCKSLVSADVSGWDTGGAKHMEGLFDGCTSLKTITTGGDFNAKAALDLGRAFRDCHSLDSASLNPVLARLGNSPFLEDAYEMCKDCYALSSLDLSTMDFSATTDLIRVAAMDEDGAYATNRLKEIIVPPTFLTATGVVLTDPEDGGSINMFWVDGDGLSDGDREEEATSDDLRTDFFVTGDTVPENLLSYNFGGDNGDNDNRTFMKLNKRTINGKDRATYAMADENDSATMKVDATMTFYTGGKNVSSAKPLKPVYSWTYEGADISGANASSYTAEGLNAGGKYVVKTAAGTLTGSNDSMTTSFFIGLPIVSISARYKGPAITIGSAYSKDDVVVTAKDGEGNVYELTSDDFTVDSLKVTKPGDNVFKVTYDTGGAIMDTTVTVPGVRRIGRIEAEYVGPSVLVGDEFDPSYVTVTAYYTDDLHKDEGFEVAPSYFSTKKVKELGDNKITVTYVDADQNDKTFSDTITVNGYKAISEITASYGGPKIKVGKDYLKKDVTVTLHYLDGGKAGTPQSTATTENFTVDSTLVKKKGDNSFTATYKDPFGNTYTAGFTVPGYKKSSKKKKGSDDDSGSGGGSSGGSSGEGGGGGGGVSTVAGPVGSVPLAAGAPVYTGTATSTGLVQTGTTGKTVASIICIIALIAVIGGALYFKHRIIKSDKED